MTACVSLRSLLHCLTLGAALSLAAPLAGGSVLCAPAQAADQSFTDWLDGFRAEAAAQGISQSTQNTLLSSVEPHPDVLEKDRRQPEFSLTYPQYRDRIVSAARVREGRALLKQHRALLTEISARYGVPPEVIVALWGIESSFGRDQGRSALVPSLATLAWDGRRGAYFRGELLNVLRMVDQMHVPPERLQGSWAGAMGQCQFMPGTYLKHARSWRGGQPADIWTRTDDVFASTAGYLADSGWQRGVRWGSEVILPDKAPADWFGQTRPALDWIKAGLKIRPGTPPLPRDSTPLTLIHADSGKGPDAGQGTPLLVSGNFAVLKTWNRSVLFAATVGTLADAIGKH